MNDCAHVLCRRGSREAARKWPASAALLVLWLCAGCTPPGGATDLAPRLQSEDPAVRAEAAVGAGQSGDRKYLPLLVDRLSDEEPDVRLMADAALRKIAGDKISDEIGWRPFDPLDLRAKAQERWRQWLAGKGTSPAAATKPAAPQGPASRTATSSTGSPPAGRTPASNPQGSTR